MAMIDDKHDELQTLFERAGREPAERDPGPGWLRSRFVGQPWPREGGRSGCPVCDAERRRVGLNPPGSK